MLNELAATYGTQVTRQQILAIAPNYGMESNLVWLTKVRVGWGIYDISHLVEEAREAVSMLQIAPAPASETPASAVVGDESADSRTDAEIIAEQEEKFAILDRMVDGIVHGHIRAMIVSGPAGIGKTYTIESALERAHDAEAIRFQKVTGFVKPTGLYRLLWENREKNNVIMLDDSDSAFQDEISLNILKTALDTTSKRIICWRSERAFKDEEGEELLRSFEFKGSIIFVTNLNFEKLAASGNKLAPHFNALMSRCFYLDLSMDTPREKLLRVLDVLERSMVDTLALSDAQAHIIRNFLIQHAEDMRELSLRSVVKLSNILRFASSEKDFVRMARATVCYTE